MLGIHNKNGIFWFFVVALLSFSFYYMNASGESCSGINRIGFAGIHTLLFFLIYYVACIYTYHLERLKGNQNKAKVTSSNFIIISFPIIFPVLMVGIIDAECKFVFSYSSVLVAVTLLFFIVDKGGYIRKRIVKDFEVRTRGSGGELFSHYPPTRASNIYIKLSIFVFIFIIMAFINLVR